ncbi:hypothetical protein DKT68_08530 [Micromonospora acroterricola]|uniref:Uncharacterized protein n=1 Tax=Micromonospora acroterricola TaxID=2202421 RepID=A0A317DD69_9ACTN|nr:hypothetical protein [Micromonospora acroterricola]PWR10595.1 hypothetical protein DKT68_08530 [Micromonospora acroterricola]
MATELILIAALAVTHALCFTAGGWYLRWRALRHQMRAAQTAISTPQYLAEVLAVYRRRLYDIRPAWLRGWHLPRLTHRRHA